MNRLLVSLLHQESFPMNLRMFLSVDSRSHKSIKLLPRNLPPHYHMGCQTLFCAVRNRILIFLAILHCIQFFRSLQNSNDVQNNHRTFPVQNFLVLPLRFTIHRQIFLFALFLLHKIPTIRHHFLLLPRIQLYRTPFRYHPFQFL